MGLLPGRTFGVSHASLISRQRFSRGGTHGISCCFGTDLEYKGIFTKSDKSQSVVNFSRVSNSHSKHDASGETFPADL